MLFVASNPVYLAVLLICVVILIAGRRQRRFGGLHAPGAGGRAARYPSSAGPGGELPGRRNLEAVMRLIRCD